MESLKRSHKYDLGIIGNCSFLALIDKEASVRWLCWPRFDSSYIFGSLLDQEAGEFSVRPASNSYTSRQYYIENTAVLVTEFQCSDGSFRVIDFAPRYKQFDRNFKPLSFNRKIELLSGSPRVRVTCSPRYDYGKEKISVFQASNHLKYEVGTQRIRLYSSIPLSYIEGEKDFLLLENESLILTFGTVVESDITQTNESSLKQTVAYWQRWSAGLALGHFHQKMVIRSAITLKLHQYDDTGAIIAAATTSLPEYPGSGRNWDYRYCWMRDSYYTLSALNSLGKFDELIRFSKYLHNLILNSSERIQPLYSILSDHLITENIIDLEGYQKSGPVRIGNQAYTHVQNDVYGQVLLSLLPLYVDARFLHTKKNNNLEVIERIVDHIIKYIDEPDAGLWEFRNLSQHHCYTYLFQWAGGLAVKKMAIQYANEGLAKKAQFIIDRSVEWIEKCFNPITQSYAQAVGGKSMDASLFQLITMSYLDPTSKKAESHFNHLVKDLSSDRGLFFRYKHQDDFGETHASFLVCAFWHVEALAAMNRVDEAVEAFENLLPYANDLGLFSEDVDAKDGSQWGNFPQTYSHVGLINSAFRIALKIDRPTFL